MNFISTTIPDRSENTLNLHRTVIGRTEGADSYDLTSIRDAMWAGLLAALSSESPETEQAERQRLSQGWRVLGNQGNPLESLRLRQLYVAADQPIRSDLKKQIEGLLETAGSANWDGEGAIAVTRKSVDVAQELVDLLPSNTGDPEVAATPHGEIDLDWIAGRDSMFTLSICPEGKLAWASLFDDFTCRGTAVWKGELPCPVGCCLQKFG